MGEVVCARARQRDEASERASARKRETEDTYTYTDRQIDRYTDRARENEAQVGVSGGAQELRYVGGLLHVVLQYPVSWQLPVTPTSYRL